MISPLEHTRLRMSIVSPARSPASQRLLTGPEWRCSMSSRGTASSRFAGQTTSSNGNGEQENNKCLEFLSYLCNGSVKYFSHKSIQRIKYYAKIVIRDIFVQLSSWKRIKWERLISQDERYLIFECNWRRIPSLPSIGLVSASSQWAEVSWGVAIPAASSPRTARLRLPAWRRSSCPLCHLHHLPGVSLAEMKMQRN